MAKIRDDFEGVVYAEGLVLKAGDKIPAGVRVGGHLTDSGKDVGPAPDEKPVSVAPVDVQDPPGRCVDQGVLGGHACRGRHQRPVHRDRPGVI